MKFEKKPASSDDIPSGIMKLPALLKDEETALFLELDRIREDIFGPDREIWFLEENRLKLECMSASRDADPVSRRIREIRDRVVAGCTRYTYYTIRRMERIHSVPFSEQFQEGLLGVVDAVFRYDTRVDARFQSFASWVIRTYVRQYRRNNSSFMKTPGRVDEIRRFLYHYKGDAKTPEEIKTVMDEKYANSTPLVTIEQALVSYWAVSEATNDGSEISVLELVSDGVDPEEEFERESQIAYIRKFLQNLPPAQYQVLSEKFGLETGEERTNVEIGAEMSLSRERIRQIESQALRNLRSMVSRDEDYKQSVLFMTNLNGGSHEQFPRRHNDRTHRGGVSGGRIPSLLGV